MVENIVGKGENDGFQHFLLNQECFQNCSSLGIDKVWDSVIKANCDFHKHKGSN